MAKVCKIQSPFVCSLGSPPTIEMVARDRIEPPTRGRGVAHCSRQRAATASAERLRRLAGDPRGLVLSK